MQEQLRFNVWRYQPFPSIIRGIACDIKKTPAATISGNNKSQVRIAKVIDIRSHPQMLQQTLYKWHQTPRLNFGRSAANVTMMKYDFLLDDFKHIFMDTPYFDSRLFKVIIVTSTSAFIQSKR